MGSTLCNIVLKAEAEDSWRKAREAKKRTLDSLRETVRLTCELTKRAVEAAIEEDPDILLVSSPGTTIKFKK